jgi:hypothetical protein
LLRLKPVSIAHVFPSRSTYGALTPPAFTRSTASFAAAAKTSGVTT